MEAFDELPAEKTKWLLKMGLWDHALFHIGESKYSFFKHTYYGTVEVYTDSTCYEGSVYFD